MANLKDIRDRIKSVKSIQKVTKAMKMVAAAKLRRAQESAEKGRPYSEKMNNIIINLSGGISDKENSPKLLSGTGEEKIHLCVVLTSDRGLCGGFNANIIKKSKVFFEGFGDSALNFSLGIWTSSHVDKPEVIKSEIYFAVFNKFKKNNVSIPFPQRDVHIKSKE